MNPAALSPNAKRPAFNHNLAALQNVDARWHAILSKLRVDILLVCFAADRESPIWSHPEIGESLGAELMQAGAGQHDSSAFRGANQFHFFHVQDLAKALGVLKRHIEARGLLLITHLMHRELPNAWRCYWSPDGKEIAQLVEDEPT